MHDLLWLVVGMLSAYILWQLGRYVTLRRRPTADPMLTSVSPSFQNALETSALRRELDELRETIAQQQAAQDHLSRSVEGLREQIGALATPRAAREYEEALICARRGLGVETIAERCGISVAEAELVRSLSGQRKMRDDASS